MPTLRHGDNVDRHGEYLIIKYRALVHDFRYGIQPSVQIMAGWSNILSADAFTIEPGSPADKGAKVVKRVRLLSLDALDRRTNAARQAFELRDRIVGERGGVDQLSALKLEMINSVAVLSAMIRDAEARYLRGEAVDPNGLATLLNARRREAERVGLDIEPLDRTPSLGEYLRQKAAAKAGDQ